MSGKHIALIYFYLISAASLALIVIGIFNVVNFGINSTQYDKYPLRYTEACESDYRYSTAPQKLDQVTPTENLSKEQIAELKKQCEVRVESQRKQERLNDLKNAIVFPIVGVILFLIHFPYAKRLTKDSK